LIYKNEPISACKFLFSTNDVVVANSSGIVTIGLDEDSDLEQETEEEEVDLEELTALMGSKLRLNETNDEREALRERQNVI
jgi:hypothetical protein